MNSANKMNDFLKCTSSYDVILSSSLKLPKIPTQENNEGRLLKAMKI